MSRFIKYFRGLSRCVMCGASGTDMDIQYIENFTDSFTGEECEVYLCTCKKCGFVFSDFI